MPRNATEEQTRTMVATRICRTTGLRATERKVITKSRLLDSRKQDMEVIESGDLEQPKHHPQDGALHDESPHRSEPLFSCQAARKRQTAPTPNSKHTAPSAFLFVVTPE